VEASYFAVRHLMIVRSRARALASARVWVLHNGLFFATQQWVGR